MNNTGQYGPTTGDPDIDAPEAWNITQGDNSIIIAVIDEGVDLTHEDLVTNLVTGYDATGLGSNGAPASGSDDAHGTAVAGIAAAVSDNSRVSGFANSVRIMPIRIAYNVSNGNGFTSMLGRPMALPGLLIHCIAVARMC
ncbi:MAG: S8 family serine peptidase [Anaerolineales bacterium]|nr:S8 family serine peptidase [Anaerolineales bacterium]